MDCTEALRIPRKAKGAPIPIADDYGTHREKCVQAFAANWTLLIEVVERNFPAVTPPAKKKWMEEVDLND